MTYVKKNHITFSLFFFLSHRRNNELKLISKVYFVYKNSTTLEQQQQSSFSLESNLIPSTPNHYLKPTTTNKAQQLSSLSVNNNTIKTMKAEQSLHSVVSLALHETLPYSIYDHSSHSGSYHPRNICINDPTEQSSRWSSGSHDQSQFVTIKLDKPAVACNIKKSVSYLYSR
jgi:hypothetical protein